ncbi:MAG TPA: hypothetical protein VJ110_03100 [Candidatus Nanoarchaeia archaeon]|nr:hypothetical protein [Candidatus Nanoarchaeia archaeon]
MGCHLKYLGYDMAKRRKARHRKAAKKAKAVYVSRSAAASAKRAAMKAAKRATRKLFRKFKISSQESNRIAKQMGRVMEQQAMKIGRQADSVVAAHSKKAFRAAHAAANDVKSTVRRLEQKVRRA